MSSCLCFCRRGLRATEHEELFRIPSSASLFSSHTHGLLTCSSKTGTNITLAQQQLLFLKERLKNIHGPVQKWSHKLNEVEEYSLYSSVPSQEEPAATWGCDSAAPQSKGPFVDRVGEGRAEHTFLSAHQPW